MYEVYARKNDEGKVEHIFSTCFEKNMEDDIFIKSGEGDEFVHVGYYKLFDNKGCHNYIIKDGVMMEMSEEEKQEEINKVEMSKKNSLESEVINNKLCVAEVTSIIFEMDDRLNEVKEKIEGEK